MIDIKEFSYDLPDERIAKFPLERRDDSKLLVFKDGNITETRFRNLTEMLPPGATLVFNDTKVIKARLIFFKPSGARIEIFCLEPYEPADYERAFAVVGKTQWRCMVGNLGKWKEGELVTRYEYEGAEHTISARKAGLDGKNVIVEFEYSDMSKTFGQILEILGKIPIPPYLNRESQDSDNTRYQTVYSKFEGSVAAPTAGLHFTDSLLRELSEKGFNRSYVTLHVGAGTFLPVKSEDAAQHVMHTEHFVFDKDLVKDLICGYGNIFAVGTTSVRTVESMSVLGYRALMKDDIAADTPIGQWEAYDIPADIPGKKLLEALLGYMDIRNSDKVKAATQIMITPGYFFRVIDGLITNFHQPQSTLLLLISAVVGEKWKDIYAYAMDNGFRFLSYGDSSLLYLDKKK